MTTDPIQTVAFFFLVLFVFSALLAFVDSNLWARISYALNWKQRDRRAKEERLAKRHRLSAYQIIEAYYATSSDTFPSDWTSAA